MVEEMLQGNNGDAVKKALEWPKPDASDSEVLEWWRELKQGGLQRIQVVEKVTAPKESDSPLWVFKTSDRKPIALDSEGLIFVFDGKRLNIYTDKLIELLREQYQEQLSKERPAKEYRFKIYGESLFPKSAE